MAVQTLAIISVISKNHKINGYSLTMKEFENLILEILKWTASEENTGEDNVKVLIS
jgi:hypothetical protein